MARIISRTLSRTVVLRGYGRFGKPGKGADYSKRAIARDQNATMRSPGFERFAVGTRDRGPRVGYRLALDRTVR